MVEKEPQYESDYAELADRLRQGFVKIMEVEKSAPPEEIILYSIQLFNLATAKFSLYPGDSESNGAVEMGPLYLTFPAGARIDTVESSVVINGHGIEKHTSRNRNPSEYDIRRVEEVADLIDAELLENDDENEKRIGSIAANGETTI